jgi:hypothetical protein
MSRLILAENSPMEEIVLEKRQGAWVLRYERSPAVKSGRGRAADAPPKALREPKVVLVCARDIAAPPRDGDEAVYVGASRCGAQQNLDAVVSRWLGD